MKRTGIVILFLFYVTSFYVCNGVIPEHVYEYGENYGNEIYNYDGVIPFYTAVTRHKISVPKDYLVSYVKVIVKSWQTPDVILYSPKTNYVTISFPIVQRLISHYSIVVKGHRIY